MFKQYAVTINKATTKLLQDLAMFDSEPAELAKHVSAFRTACADAYAVVHNAEFEDSRDLRRALDELHRDFTRASRIL